MIRPLSFGFNNDTSNDNYFQKNVDHLTKSKIIIIRIPTIQTCGGGSVRCMIAELI